MLSKKTLTALAIVVIVIIGLAIALLLVDEGIFNPSSKDPAQNLNGNVNESAANNNLPKTEEKPPVIPTSDEQHITTVARNFAERFASFSSDSKYANLEEVKILSTAKLIKRLEEIMENENDLEIFYGISSKVLKVKINQLNEETGSAETTVTLQREEERQGQETRVYYQDLVLSLISSGSDWLVDSFIWQTFD